MGSGSAVRVWWPLARSGAGRACSSLGGSGDEKEREGGTDRVATQTNDAVAGRSGDSHADAVAHLGLSLSVSPFLRPASQAASPALVLFADEATTVPFRRLRTLTDLHGKATALHFYS